MVNAGKIKVVVGITNSADSKVAAYLLNRQGHEVLGVTFFYQDQNGHKNLKDDPTDKKESTYFKCRLDDSKEIRNFCQKLGIQHFGYQAHDEFKDEVIDTCVAYRIKTASQHPCFGCSKLTLKLLDKKARELGADFIATGHYAKVHYSQISKSYFLNAANDINSDQSFLIANTSQNILGRLLLPLGDLRKVEVTKISERQGWKDASGPIENVSCFSGAQANHYLEENVANSLLKEGDIVLLDDDMSIGTHEGLHRQVFGEKFVGELYPTTPYGDYIVVDINRYNGKVYVEERNKIFWKKIFLNDLELKKSAPKDKPRRVLIKFGKDPVSYAGNIHFKNNNSCLILLEKRINKILPSGTFVSIYEELIGGRMSVLGMGRVKYEAKFLEFDREDESIEESQEFEL